MDDTGHINATTEDQDGSVLADFFDEEEGWTRIPEISLPEIEPIQVQIPVNYYVSEATFRRWMKNGLIPARAKRVVGGLLHDCPP